MPKNTSSQSLSSNAEPKRLLGKVVGFLGLKGTLKVRPATNNPSLFLDVEDVTFRLKSQEEETVKVESARIGKNNLELLLEDHPTRSSVEHLLNADVFVEQAQIASLSDNEWWVADLVGMQVFTTDGTFIGTVCDALGKEGQFLEIQRDGREKSATVLVPFVRQIVPVVDVSSRRIEVVDLPGLLD